MCVCTRICPTVPWGRGTNNCLKLAECAQGADRREKELHASSWQHQHQQRQWQWPRQRGSISGSASLQVLYAVIAVLVSRLTLLLLLSLLLLLLLLHSSAIFIFILFDFFVAVFAAFAVVANEKRNAQKYKIYFNIARNEMQNEIRLSARQQQQQQLQHCNNVSLQVNSTLFIYSVLALHSKP